MKQAAALDAIEPARRGPLHGLAIGGEALAACTVVTLKDEQSRMSS